MSLCYDYTQVRTKSEGVSVLLDDETQITKRVNKTERSWP